MSKRVWDGAGYYSACSQNLVWWLFWFLWDEEDNYFTREAEIIIDIVYDLDNDWFRIFTLERDIYQIKLFKCEPIIFYVPLGCIFILELFILGNIENKYS